MNPLRRVFKNLGVLSCGRIGSALLNLGAMGILARALDLDGFGTVVLMHVYVLTVRGVVDLRPYLVIVRYGVALLDSRNDDLLNRLIGRTRRIDRLSALAAVLVGILLAAPAGWLFGWQEDAIRLAMGYSLVLAVSGTGTAIGLLRACNRFGELAVQVVVGPCVRCAGAALLTAAGSGLAWFVLVWAVSLLCEFGYVNWRGRRLLNNRGIRPACLPNLAAELPGLWRFVRLTYVQYLLELVPQRFSTLAAGAVVGTGPAGLFRTARECSTVLAQPAELLRQVVFPDLTRLWSRDRRAFRSVLNRIVLAAAATGGAFAGIAVLAGEWFLTTAFGPAFAAAAPLLSWLMLCAAFELTGAVFVPAAYAMDRAGTTLLIQAVSVAVLVALFLPLEALFGLTGLGIAMCASALGRCLAMLIFVRGLAGAAAVDAVRSNTIVATRPAPDA